MTRTLLERDPAGIDGATLVLADCRVHFGPRMGAVICVEYPGRPGYEIVTTAADHPIVHQWQEGVERPARTLRMSREQVRAWDRACAAVGREDATESQEEATAWTATLDDDADAICEQATGSTPEAAVAALDAATRHLDPAGPPLQVLRRRGRRYVVQGDCPQILGRVFPTGHPFPTRE